jgi:hypothetical protein
MESWVILTWQSTQLGPDGDIDAFWGKVKANLMAGRIRMLLVADVISPSFARSSNS